MRQMDLDVMAGDLAVCRLDPNAPVPDWAGTGPLTSVTRTPTELSIVCSADAVPSGTTTAAPWRALTVRGPLAFELTGIAAALTTPLAEAGVSVFLVSTYDTDHVLVRAEALERAIEALRGAGHEVHRKTEGPANSAGPSEELR
jgi:hypothetical protein